ncbi:MAG TPA: hypothetical protein VN285_13640 [Candidatus Deferrimicrobium sp.]|nr:hypothetical protein [Candidatus Deferrimicrobium sp.]
MPFGKKPQTGALWLVPVLWTAVILLASANAEAQPQLFVRVGDTTANSGEQNSVISIYMNNYYDTVAGFNLYLQLDYTNLIEFKTDTGTSIDTTYWDCLQWNGQQCVDSVPATPQSYDIRHIDTSTIYIGNFDTAGTLCSGWEWIEARSVTGTGFDLNIAGLANQSAPPYTPGIAPQQGTKPLIKIRADVFNVPDTVTERTVTIYIVHDWIDHFNFSDPEGSSFCIGQAYVPDTNCWICTAWFGEDCVNWERVTIPPPGGCDSLEFVTDTVPFIDESCAILIDGSLTVESFKCGDVDGSTKLNVADLTYLVAYLFTGGPAPIPLASGNMDCSVSQIPNVADLTWLVAFLFTGGAAPCAC